MTQLQTEAENTFSLIIVNANKETILGISLVASNVTQAMNKFAYALKHETFAKAVQRSVENLK